ncbi:MAG: type 1 glutamine amidotransferase [Lysobacterales bacterium]|nr:MAG: type 1 glutamine amidotransferase [Xanthomonadales bacterium]
MRIVIFQHIACEHPGTFRDFMRDDGAVTRTVELDDGEPIPRLDDFDALMVMGGPMDVWHKERHPWLETEIAAIREWVAVKRRPFLGFCLGHQLLAEALGGSVGPASEPEIGVMNVELTQAGRASPFLENVPHEIPCFQWHSAEVIRAPDGAEILASSPACKINAMSWGTHAFSIQFHIEITSMTVTEWGGIPEYATTLEQSLGENGLLRLKKDSDAQLANFHTISKQLYTNFMEIARA